MTTEQLYTAPSEEIFNQIKAASIIIWSGYDNTYGYSDEKIGYIKPLKNIRDNYATIIGMFDYQNQEKLIDLLDGEAKRLVMEVTEPERLARKQMEGLG